MRQTDRRTYQQDEANGRFSQIYERSSNTHTKSNNLHNAVISYMGLLFLIFCHFCASDITNIFFTELGKLRRYESSSFSLRRVCQ